MKLVNCRILNLYIYLQKLSTKLEFVAAKITSYVTKWKDPSNNDTLEALLLELSDDRHWPGGHNKPGARAADYVQKVNKCTGLMLHAPGTHCIAMANGLSYH